MQHSTRFFWFVIFSSLMVFVASPAVLTAFGQQLNTQTGWPSFSSQDHGVNLGSLNVHLTIPVVHRNGRGIGFNLDLTYDSTFYVLSSTATFPITPAFAVPPAFYMPCFLGGTCIQPPPLFGWGNNVGAPGISGVSIAGSVNGKTQVCSANSSAATYGMWSYTDSRGTVHPLPASLVVSTDPACGPAQASAYVTDQTGYLVTVKNDGSGTAQDLAGNTTQISYSPSTGSIISTITDWNGNQISDNSAGTFTDTLNITALSVSSITDSSGNPVSQTYTYPASGGNVSVVVNYKQYPRVASGFGCANTQEYTSGAAVSLVDNIVLADNSRYSFTYEPTSSSSPVFVSGAVTGRLASVTLPTGATVSYGYPGPNGGINCADATLMQLTVTTSDGARTYSRNISTGNSLKYTLVTDPQGNQTVVSFNTVSNPQNPAANPIWIESQRQVIQGTWGKGPVLEVITTCYNGDRSLACTANPVMPITDVARFRGVPFSGGVAQTAIETVLDATTGRTTEANEYDVVHQSGYSPQAGPLLRKTLISYASLGNNVSRPASVTICSPGGSNAACGGNGTPVAQTTLGYDETAPTATSGIPQHVAVTGSRGNTTSVHRWLNTGGTLNTTHTYDDAGNVLTTTDPGGHTTTFGYACNDAFPSSVTEPDTASIHHITTATYDCTTGLLLTSTDQNGAITNYHYDNISRLTETDFPDGGQTTASYPDPNHVSVQRKIDVSRFTSSTAVLDGYGRTSRTAITNGESAPYDQQDFCYDGNGRLGFSSYPYQGNSPNGTASCPNTTLAGDTFAYDALGRPVSVTHSDGSSTISSYSGMASQVTDEGNGTLTVTRIRQKDGLGNLQSVCEIYSGSALLGSGGTPAACGQDIAGTGFLTSYGYDFLGNLTSVSQGTLANRTFTYDSLSRMTSETTPEAGTVTYSYNADSLLTQRVRPTANQTNAAVSTTTTYSYDALNRLTQRSYSDGTPTANFLYDVAVGWGVSQPNVIGRLSKEWTVNSSAAMASGSIFGYDPMGRITANNQCTPLNCGTGNWSSGYQYDLMGDITSGSNGVGVEFAYMYNVTPRLTGMTSSLADAQHPGTILSNAHYSPSTITDALGNGEVETTNFSARGLLQSQQIALSNGSPASGSITITGSLQLTSSITVTIGGSDSTNATTTCFPGPLGHPVCHTSFTADMGTISFSVAVGGTTIGPVSASYNGTSTGAGLAAALFSSFPANSLVSMSNPNGSSSFTLSVIGGSGTFSTSAVSSCNPNVSVCGGVGWTFTPSSANFTSGQINYDSGETTITVSGHPDSYNWSGTGTTAATIAQGLCASINGDSGSFVTASTNGLAGQCPLGSTTIGLVSKQDGASSDAPLSVSFSSALNSFSASCAGFSSCASATLTGGGTPAYSYILGLAPNGNVLSANDSVNGNWSFSYDAFNRLVGSNKNSGQTAFSYVYDRYSNRWQQNLTAGQGGAPQYTFDTSNHIVGSGVTYDALGNVTNDGFHAYFYDAENRLIQVDGTLGNCSSATACYIYDAEGRRIQGPHGYYLYDLAGHMVTQIGLNGVWNFGEIYAGGRHVATYSGSTTNFFHSDWLGTKRVMTALNGTVSQACTGFPFSDGVNCTGTNWNFNGFTDLIHDSETNLEHALFRQYSSTQGRWLTPDPLGSGSSDITNPQTWNRYTYVKNNPINANDPTGLDSGDEGGFGLCGSDDCSFVDMSGPLDGSIDLTDNGTGLDNYGAEGFGNGGSTGLSSPPDPTDILLDVFSPSGLGNVGAQYGTTFHPFCPLESLYCNLFASPAIFNFSKFSGFQEELNLYELQLAVAALEAKGGAGAVAINGNDPSPALSDAIARLGLDVNAAPADTLNILSQKAPTAPVPIMPKFHSPKPPKPNFSALPVPPLSGICSIPTDPFSPEDLLGVLVGCR